MKARQTKWWLKSPEAFKRYFVKTTLKLLAKYEKNVKSMLKTDLGHLRAMHEDAKRRFVGLCSSPRLPMKWL